MNKAQPGDTILVHAGLYRPERLNYVDPLSAPFTGILVAFAEGYGREAHHDQGRRRR